MSEARNLTAAGVPKGDPAQAPSEGGDGGGARARTCIGCGAKDAPSELVRLVIGPGGEIAVDAAGGGFGRGAHVHARAACLLQAASRGIARAAKGRATSVSVAVKAGGGVATSEAVPFDAGALASAIEAAMARRIAGLVAASVRTRRVRIGSDAVTAAWRAGEAALVIVATDAAAAADLSAVREAIAAGAAVAWGTKQVLAAALGKRDATEGVAVLAIMDTRIAGAVRDAVSKAMGARSGERGEGGARGERKTRARRADDAAPTAGLRSKVAAERAGRAPGRHLRRAQDHRQ